MLYDMKCVHCQSALEPEQMRCASCGTKQKARRKRHTEFDTETLTPEAQVLLERANQQYHWAIWGLIPGVGLILGPWVCWSLLHLRGKAEAESFASFLLTTFRIALMIALFQWSGLLLILLSCWMT